MRAVCLCVRAHFDWLNVEHKFQIWVYHTLLHVIFTVVQYKIAMIFIIFIIFYVLLSKNVISDILLTLVMLLEHIDAKSFVENLIINQIN